MKILFSICDNNYLDKAKVFFDSASLNNQDYTYFLFLSDKKSDEIDYSNIKAEIIEADKLPIDDYENFYLKYSIVEFSTAIKPYIFQYLVSQHKDCENVLYFDPDIKVYSSFIGLEEELNIGSVLLTPHCLTPMKISDLPFENTFLNYGIYNLGFIGIKNDNNAKLFLDWWTDRVFNYCYDDVVNGLFVDQLFITIAPVYFNFIVVSRNLGLNVAYWNLFERTLSQKENVYYAGNQSLVFFHFSSFEPTINYLTIRNCNYYFLERNDLKRLFLEYKTDLEDANKFYSGKYKNHYVQLREKYIVEKRKHLIKSNFKSKFFYILSNIIPNSLFIKIHNSLSYLKKVNPIYIAN